MTSIRKLLLVTIIIVLCDFTISKRQFRSKRSGRDYVLHSCTATANVNLVRKNRNHALTGDDILRNSSAMEFPFSLPKRNSKYHSPIKAESAINHTRNDERGKIKSPTDKRLYGRRIEDHQHHHHQNVLSQLNQHKDTPLKTIRIRSFQKNHQPIFSLKDPLPELERHIPGRKIKTPASFVVVRSLH
ncbi:uncharacterized protein LOC122502138 [Leptopilina heterotoma]|uniref:uncharacterized protein LOC122502138 n=1 Tax=Leptopilina heterotoma TaxID=63436 RepID=UPI001CA8DEB1|nr:uncharacterized protein LOC122502138 [Leptopilina heterotoma]